MGRTNRPNCIPQRPKAIEDQEASRNIKDNIFGPHRLVVGDSSQELHDVMQELQGDGHIPEHVIISRFFRATLLEKAKMRKSLQRGIIGGYRIGAAVASIEHRIGDALYKPLEVELGRVGLMDRRDNTIVVAIGNDVMQHDSENPISTVRNDQDAIVDTLEEMGLRGTQEMRDFRPLVVLGTGSQDISRTEKIHIQHVLEDVLPETIMLGEVQMGLPRRGE